MLNLTIPGDVRQHLNERELVAELSSENYENYDLEAHYFIALADFMNEAGGVSQNKFINAIIE